MHQEGVKCRNEVVKGFKILFGVALEYIPTGIKYSNSYLPQLHFNYPKLFLSIQFHAFAVKSLTCRN